MKHLLLTIALAAVSAGVYAATPATFPGGQEALSDYLNANVVYPAFARDNGIEGTVTVLFVVGTDGSISNVKVARPLDPDLEAEAVRIVKNMPNWTPATDDAGTPVSSEATLPVKFRLSN
ncbi:MAG: energy transducer TonB [Muribaculaceae bacterium]|nr:energy transducer TonB [Muribaculaceae bacterium]